PVGLVTVQPGPRRLIARRRLLQRPHQRDRPGQGPGDDPGRRGQALGQTPDPKRCELRALDKRRLVVITDDGDVDGRDQQSCLRAEARVDGLYYGARFGGHSRQCGPRPPALTEHMAPPPDTAPPGPPPPPPPPP